MFYDKKVLVIESAPYDENLNIQVQEISTANELVNKFVQDISNDTNAIDTLLQNDYFVKALDAKGYRNIEKLKRVEDKVTASKRYYVYSPGSYSGGSLRELNLDNLTAYDLEDQKILLQSVNRSCLAKINPKVYKRFQELEKRKAENEILKQERAKKRAEKKKQKEIEAAKKLLESAGEL